MVAGATQSLGYRVLHLVHRPDGPDGLTQNRDKGRSSELRGETHDAIS